jgi:hypothetical protein
MQPIPIEITNHKPQSYLGLLPQLAKLVLSSMPTSGLLTHNAISALYTLRQSFADIMLYLITTQGSLIPTPTISMHSLQSVLAWVLTTNSAANSSVCLPTRPVRISPLNCAKLIAIQQSPASSSWGKQCFCFFRQTTTTHPQQ